MTRIARSKATSQQPVGEVEYRRNRPLTTISTSPRVLLMLSKLGKNKSGRFSRYALRYHGLIERTLVEVNSDFREKELQQLAERLFTTHGWHDRIAETVTSPEDFLRMLEPDGDTPMIAQVVDVVRSYEPVKTLALIEELERRIADIREEERNKKTGGAPPQKRTSKTDVVVHNGLTATSTSDRGEERTAPAKRRSNKDGAHLRAV